MRKVHTRMPVILSMEDAQRWVDVDHHSWASVKPLMKPFEGSAILCSAGPVRRLPIATLFAHFLSVPFFPCWCLQSWFLQSSSCREQQPQSRRGMHRTAGRVREATESVGHSTILLACQIKGATETIAQSVATSEHVPFLCRTERISTH
jgi:hypothetical protein